MGLSKLGKPQKCLVIQKKPQIRYLARLLVLYPEGQRSATSTVWMLSRAESLLPCIACSRASQPVIGSVVETLHISLSGAARNVHLLVRVMVSSTETTLTLDVTSRSGVSHEAEGFFKISWPRRMFYAGMGTVFWAAIDKVPQT